jgi:cytochrome c553
METTSLASRIGRTGRTLAATACAAVLPLASAAQDKPAKPDLKRGQEIASTVCGACHGADGNSTIAANPKLSGQDPAYLLKQLNDYAKPTDEKSARVNAVMAGMVGAISTADRHHVAAYYATQAHKPGVSRNRETLELGQRIYRAGVPAKGIPACNGCHSPTGAGVPSQYPRLGGQHAEYVDAQLKAFRDGIRRNNLPMAHIAARMSDAEMAAVADYVAGLR